MNYWKVSILYLQMVHDYTKALTTAHTSYWNTNLATYGVFQTTDSCFKQ